MAEGVPKLFTSPEEEVQYLRGQIALREREMLGRHHEVDRHDTESIARETLREYGHFTPKVILSGDRVLDGHDLASHQALIEVAGDPAEEIALVAVEKGIRNALTLLEKVTDAYVIDEVHRKLIEHIRGGQAVQDLKEGVPPWQIMHMALFEVTLPELKGANDREYQLGELIGMMEQLFSGMRMIASVDALNQFVFEIAVADQSDDIIFYVAVPREYVSLFEKQTLSLFPHAVITEQIHDYNIFVGGGTSIVAEVGLKKHPLYPLRTPDTFSADPLAVILNAFSKIEREGGGAAIQCIVRYPKIDYRKNYQDIIKRVEKGMKPKEAIARSTFTGEFSASVGDFFAPKPKKDPAEVATRDVDHKAVELFGKKLSTAIVETTIRIAVSALVPERTTQILSEIEATFHQFEHVDGNQFVFTHYKGGSLKAAEKAFSFREFNQKAALPLSLSELATLIHFPGNGIVSSPQFKQSSATTAAAPTEIPHTGTLLGSNLHRNTERKIFITPEDRLRHFYIIGQTGTGKTTLMKNMIVQDILRGDGVCMIDPHGTDIEDVLGSIPPERENDIIYFDPSQLEHPVGLNMLEFDPQKPEQKTFVVNELFSIFQRLYGANPESMGPMFEQYFRNATLLVMEDPDSGNTLMDISRVMADSKYRRMKLEKAKNPVVVQFWREIATKAGGEAALENIVPYIVSKFDVFTANDYMRPIIGQQKSAFNFRTIMDEKKILLVNLSKGRLGEINANLIGMIIVGKILMAALSRVDDSSKSFPPFYLHMDEFQNISTNSISAILSEARKYKLGLTIAHQFIAQLDQGIREAVFGNVGSMAVFRVGADDASTLESQFLPVFNASDLMNVPNRNAYVRVLADGTPAKPFSMSTCAPLPVDYARVAALITASAARYGRPRSLVEAEIQARYAKEPVMLPPLQGGVV